MTMNSYICALYGSGQKKDTQSPGIEIIDSFEPQDGCWESNPDPMEEQPALLTSDSSLQPLGCCIPKSKFSFFLNDEICYKPIEVIKAAY